MTLSVLGTAANVFGGGPISNTETIPGSPVAGDWLLAHYTCSSGGINNAQFEMEDGAGDIIAVGDMLVANFAGLQTSIYVAVRQLTAADIAQGQVRLRRSNDGQISLGVFQLVTFRSTEGIDSITAGTIGTGNGTSITAPGYNATPAAAVDDWLFAVYGTDPNNPAVTFTDPAGWTRVIQSNGNIRPGGLIVRRAVTAAGAQADATATISSTENYQAVQILVKEISAGGVVVAGGGFEALTASDLATATKVATGAGVEQLSAIELVGAAKLAAGAGLEALTDTDLAQGTKTTAGAGIEIVTAAELAAGLRIALGGGQETLALSGIGTGSKLATGAALEAVAVAELVAALRLASGAGVEVISLRDLVTGIDVPDGVVLGGGFELIDLAELVAGTKIAGGGGLEGVPIAGLGTATRTATGSGVHVVLAADLVAGTKIATGAAVEAVAVSEVVSATKSASGNLLELICLAELVVGSEPDPHHRAPAHRTTVIPAQIRVSVIPGQVRRTVIPKES
ncbi:MAG: hypothetical protein AAGA17_00115 [Actinomycetota bacterium]